MKQNVKTFSLLMVLVIAQFGCAKGTTDETSDGSDTTSNTSQSAMAEANSQASASESAGAVGVLSSGDRDFARLGDAVDPGDVLHPLATTCTFATTRGACVTNADTVAWGGCTVDSGAVTLTGGWNEAFSGTGAASCTVPVASGGSVTRTSSASTMTLTGGATMVSDTAGGTAWDGTVIPSTGTTVSNTAGTRTITVNGMHKIGKGPRGRTLFDHYITTPTPLTVTGLRSTSNRAITGGTMKVYHQLLRYTAAISFSGVQWTSSTCCYPTTGSISTTLSGSLTGTTSMTFTSACGSSTYVDNAGSSSTVTLNQCN